MDISGPTWASAADELHAEELDGHAFNNVRQVRSGAMHEPLSSPKV